MSRRRAQRSDRPSRRLVAHLADTDLTDSAPRTAEGFLAALGETATSAAASTVTNRSTPRRHAGPRPTGCVCTRRRGPMDRHRDAALAFDPLSLAGAHVRGTPATRTLDRTER